MILGMQTTCRMKMTSILTENVDDIRDANNMQNEDDKYLDSVRKGVGEFYKKHVMSRMATTNLRSSIKIWEEKATLSKEKIGEGDTCKRKSWRTRSYRGGCVRS